MIILILVLVIIIVLVVLVLLLVIIIVFIKEGYLGVKKLLIYYIEVLIVSIYYLLKNTNY